MSIRVICIAGPRRRGEGLRIGVVRYPPRGKPRGSLYDAWLPELSPSKELITEWKERPELTRWWLRRFRAEMSKPMPKHLIMMLAELSRRTNLSIGCYCPDEESCHRSVLRELLEAKDAEIC